MLYNLTYPSLQLCITIYCIVTDGLKKALKSNLRLKVPSVGHSCNYFRQS